MRNAHGSFAVTRGGVLTSNSPTFGQGDEQQGEGGGSTASTFNVELGDSVEAWIGGAYTDFDTDFNGLLSDGDAQLLQGGVDIRFGDSAQIGLMIAGEWIDSAINTVAGVIHADGSGYFVGPYAIVGVAEHINFEGSALGGAFSNDYKLPNGNTAKFESNRILLSAGLSGDWSDGAWSHRPSTRVTYYAEGQEEFTDPGGNPLDVSTVQLGQLRFGHEIGYSFDAADGLMLRPVIGAEGVWTFHQSDVTVNNSTANFDDLSANVSIGLGAAFGRAALSIRGRLDGVGSDTFEANTAEAQLRIKLD